MTNPVRRDLFSQHCAVVDAVAAAGVTPNAEVRQCIVATTVEAGNDEQFRTAAKVVADGLAVWWPSVTDWLGVLTVQDFVGLGRFGPVI
jgi:hypothetical protein